ncbi:hypothetical protein [Thiocystis violascens]|uniref:Uncharacterized protein n=1 Tax=Thiocystis violascens (strain ATCC 17096 / DSM 198 / 6111) TaxID=765911 RepID=I3YEH3_THIV6|nr:hypothetical protein [Thiocystis violascens]AFL75391.1 hypothetical protein Thivi_3524 [Thiocystis violascens DSM 198]
MALLYYARATCRHRRSCQGALFFSARATVISPDFPTLEALDNWRRRLTRAERRCRWCGRPIAARHFERRALDPSVSPASRPVDNADG